MNSARQNARPFSATCLPAVWTATDTFSGCATCHNGNGVTPATDTYTREHQTHRCQRCHSSSTTRTCSVCHAGYSPFGPTGPTVNPATHVDGTVEINSSVSVDGKSFTLTWSPTGGSGFGSCTTDCHSVSAHGVAPTQWW